MSAGPQLAEPLSYSYQPSDAVHLASTLQHLAHGQSDPTFRAMPDGATWRTTLLPSGPATCRMIQVGPRQIDAQAWGAGATEALERLPDLLGARDDRASFDALAIEVGSPQAGSPQAGSIETDSIETTHLDLARQSLRDLHRRHPGLHIPRTGSVLEALIPAVLEQRVIGRTATAAWRWLLEHHGSAAPGPAPAGMRVVPSPEGWLGVPSWDFHRAGVDPGRARTILACARVAHRLEETTSMSAADASRRLQAVPGVGPWTAAEVAQRALGDADAVSVGDYHLAAAVGWALVGARVDDARMLELLEPWRGHRYRVIRLLELSGRSRAPRRGARLTIQDHRRN